MSATLKITGERKQDALAAALDWVESYEGQAPDGTEMLLGSAMETFGAEALIEHAEADPRTYPTGLIDAAVLFRTMLAPKPPKLYDVRLANKPLGLSAKVTMQAQDARSARQAARQHAVAEWGGNIDDWQIETTEAVR